MSAHDGSPTVPAGWYGDPLARGRERYWDGQDWTDDVRRAELTALPDLPPRPVEPEEQPPPATPPRQQWPGQEEPLQQWQAGGPSQPRQAWQAGGQVQPQPRPASGGATPVAARPGSLAGFWRRLGATSIDAVICDILTGLVTFPVLSGVMRRSWDFALAHPNATLNDQMAASQSIVTPQDAMLLLLGSVLVSLLYGTVLLAWRGATVGQSALRLRVVPRGEPDHRGGIGVAAAFVRSLVWSMAAQWATEPLLGVLLLFCAVPVFATQDRQGLHDRLARTQVVVRPLSMPTR